MIEHKNRLGIPPESDADSSIDINSTEHLKLTDERGGIESDVEQEVEFDRFEAQALQVQSDVESKIAEFEQSQQNIAEQLNFEKYGEHAILLKEDVDALKERTGLQKSIDRLSADAAALRDSFKMKILDARMARAMQDVDQPYGRVTNSNYKLRKLLGKLDTEQVRFYPAIIKRAKKETLEGYQRILNDYGYSESKIQNPAANGAMELFSHHPQILEEIFNDEQTKQIQEEIFLKILHAAHYHPLANKLPKSLHMDSGRAKELFKEALINCVDRKGANYKHIYDVDKKIKEFEVEDEFVDRLALDTYLTAYASDYPFPDKDDLKYNYGFDDKKTEQFLKEHHRELIIGAYKGMANTLVQGVQYQSYCRSQRKHMGIDLEAEDSRKIFESMPERDEIIKLMVLEIVAKPDYSKSLEEVFHSRFAMGDEVDGILSSEEGKKALYRGALNQIVYNGSVEEIQRRVAAYDLDIEKLRSDPETVANVKQLITKRLGSNNFSWPSSLIEYLQIPTEELRSLLIDAAGHLIFSQLDLEGFKLLKTLELTREEERHLSREIFGVDDAFSYLKMVEELVLESKNWPLFNVLVRERERFAKKTPEQIRVYARISEDILNSPSQEIIRIKDQLIDQILNTDDPEKSYELVKNIFIQNNLPVVGKVQRIFDALYPDKVFKSKIRNESSPVLKSASERRRKQVIFEDLLKVHIESGNRSLKQFLELIRDSEPLIEKLNTDQKLAQNEQKKLAYVFAKLKTTGDVSQERLPGKKSSSFTGNLKEDHEAITAQLGVKPSQTIGSRVVEMFVRPLGYESIDSVLEEMQQSKSSADERNREIANDRIILENGDLAKAVQSQYLENILQNGSVAREYLGSDSGSDSTPFDTDVEVLTGVTSTSFYENYSENIRLAKTGGYGDIMLVIKNRGQFVETDVKQPARYNRDKYELFATGLMRENHYGIRTGFPSTEIDYMVTPSKDPKELDNIKFKIAQNGFYIPLVDTSGELIYTPEQYDEYRKVFEGISQFEGKDVPFTDSSKEKYADDLERIVEEKQVDNERLQNLHKEIRDLVLEVLEQYNIKLKAEYDDSLLGAELLDIGSTGRGTSVPGDGDFDFNLKLDAKDFEKFNEISHEIISRLGTSGKEQPLTPHAGNNYQMRFFGSNAFSEKGIDIDIGFVRKSDLNVYASHDAIKDKLENIRLVHGDKASDTVVANILLAKEWLKEGKAYKKGSHGEGGLGGIGVENLIMAHGGNLREAFASFYTAAKNSDGSFKSFEQFKGDYKILDAGMNLRYNNHDNFVLNMTSEGYQNMLQVIKTKLNLK